MLAGGVKAKVCEKTVSISLDPDMIQGIISYNLRILVLSSVHIHIMYMC